METGNLKLAENRIVDRLHADEVARGDDHTHAAPYDSQTREFWSYEAKFTDGQCVEIACIEYEKPTQDNGYKTE